MEHDPDLDYAWHRYAEAEEQWNADYMNNLLGLDEYYPHTGKRGELEGTIQRQFKDMSPLLRDIRYGAETDDATRKKELMALDSMIQNLYGDLYFFETGLKEKTP